MTSARQELISAGRITKWEQAEPPAEVVGGQPETGAPGEGGRTTKPKYIDRGIALTKVDDGRPFPGAAAAGSRFDSFDLPDLHVSQTVENFGSVSAMVLDSIVTTVLSLLRRDFPWRECLSQAWMMVTVSLLPTILISVPFGTIIVLEVGGLATQIGTTSFVGSIDAIISVREVAPIVTALILSGAAGSAICSDLGSRTIRDEIAAMEVMGLDPIQRLVAPRLLAGLVVAVLLNGIVAFAGIVSAYATAVYVLHASAGSYLDAFSAFAQPADIIESTLKAAIFGFVGTVLASYKGLTTKRGAAGVGEAVNQAVVINGVALFFLNLVLTEIFLVIVPVKVP